MCGIAGCLNYTAGGSAIGPDVLRMTKALAHRGPDDEGMLFWRKGKSPVRARTDATIPALHDALAPAEAHLNEPWHVALGHRRFSIIDVSAQAHQPFADPDGRAAVVFNGEIYNYLELREELQKLGVVFRTHSDTEVLVQAYLTWGEAMLPKLNGMWAFALLDLRTGRLLLSRDRVGEKPLFFARVDSTFYFSSEISTLLQVPEIYARRKPDEARIWAYLYLGLRDHRPGSFFSTIGQLAPGHFAWVEADGTLQQQSFWKLPTARWSSRDLSFEEAAAGLTEQLRRSVILRLRADVPVSSELSGGMDSSSIVSLASEYLQGIKAPQLQTVTIRYPQREFDESPLAEEVAQRCSVPWESICLEAQNFWSLAGAMSKIQAQPYESPNLLGSRFIWSWMRDRGIRVTLSGGGGDELLAGYTFAHLPPFLAELMAQGRWLSAWKEARQWLGGPYLSGTIMRRHFLHQLPGLLGDRYSRRIFSLPFYRSLRRPPEADMVSLVKDLAITRPMQLSPWLQNNCSFAPIPMYMTHGDKLAMSIPLEVRFPFLDPELMDYAFRLPVAYFFRHGESKAVLREAMRNRLPASIINRREKMGFPVPLAHWMKEGRAHIEADVRENTRISDFVDVEGFCRTFDQQDPNMIWRIYQVATWMRLFNLH